MAPIPTPAGLAVRRPGRRPRRASAVVALLGVVIATGLAVTVPASPAAAHATVVATTPADGESVRQAPADFTVTFSEPVDISLGGLTVLDRGGDRVDVGDTVSEEGGRRLRVALRPDLPEGTFVGTWRVVSIDGHPIGGSALFAVGTPVDPSGMGSLGARTEPAWEVAGAVARFVAFTAALLAAGAAFFLAFVHDQRDDRWRLVPTIRVAALLGALGTIATVAVQAALATGRGWAAVTDPETLRTLLTESIGWSSGVLAAGLVLVVLSTTTHRLVAAQALALGGWVVVSVSFVLWGHATEAPYRWITLVSDGAHVAAAALWFGGLVGLAIVLRSRGRAQRAEAAAPVAARPDPTGTHDLVPDGPEVVSSTAAVVGRFSDVAAASVIVLLVAGVAMTLVQTDGSPSALWTTTYGRLVLAKVGLVVAVLAVAAFNRRRLVPTIRAGARTEDDGAVPSAWTTLCRALVVEAAVLVAALAVTAVLVNVTPARTAVAQAGTTVRLSAATTEGSVELTVQPAWAGSNTMTVQYLDAEGEPLDVATDLRIDFALPAQGIGPLARSVVKNGPGSFVLQGTELSLPGSWQVTLAVRPSDFREVRTPFTVEVS
jgi:copper transport protein